MATPENYGLPYEDLTLDTVDGIKIKCYLLLQRKQIDSLSLREMTDKQVRGQLGCYFGGGGGGNHIDFLSLFLTVDPHFQFSASRPTVIMFHGNGGNMGHRIPLAHVFYSQMWCNVLMVSYRG